MGNIRSLFCCCNTYDTPGGSTRISYNNAATNLAFENDYSENPRLVSARQSQSNSGTTNRPSSFFPLHQSDQPSLGRISKPESVTADHIDVTIVPGLFLSSCCLFIVETNNLKLQSPALYLYIQVDFLIKYIVFYIVKFNLSFIFPHSCYVRYNLYYIILLLDTPRWTHKKNVCRVPWTVSAPLYTCPTVLPLPKKPSILLSP